MDRRVQRRIGFGAAAVVALCVAMGIGMRPAHEPVEPALPPVPVAPVPNGVDDFGAATRLLMASGGVAALDKLDRANAGNVALAQMTPAQLPAFRQAVLPGERRVLAGAAPVFALIAQGLSKPCAVPAMRDRFADPPTWGYRLTRLIAARMDDLAARGRHAEAFQAGLDAYRIANALERHGCLSNTIGANRMRGLIRCRLAASVVHLTPAEAAPAARGLRAVLAEQPPITAALEEERAATIRYVTTTVRTRELGVNALEGDRGGDRIPLFLRRAYGKSAWHRRGESIYAQIDRYYRQWEDQAMRAPSRRVPVPYPADSAALCIAAACSTTDIAVHEKDRAVAGDTALIASLDSRCGHKRH